MTYDLTKLENKLAVSIGEVSCVGGITGYDVFPKNRGNYFFLITEDGFSYEIANFWFEDFKHLLDEEAISFPIPIKLLEGRWAVIYDTRVPTDFYSDTSSRAPEKYWSVTQRAIRQCKIDAGIIKLHKTKSGFELETENVDATRRTLDVKWSAAPDEYKNPYLEISQMEESTVPKHDGAIPLANINGFTGGPIDIEISDESITIYNKNLKVPWSDIGEFKPEFPKES